MVRYEKKKIKSINHAPFDTRYVFIQMYNETRLTLGFIEKFQRHRIYAPKPTQNPTKDPIQTIELRVSLAVLMKETNARATFPRWRTKGQDSLRTRDALFTRSLGSIDQK